jgi:hypothetical protein
MKQQDGDCRRVRGEQGKEMYVIRCRVVVGHGDLILGKRVNGGFPLSPNTASALD